jgi:hypothetical protein
MSEKRKHIGFSSQRIRVAWMDHAARLARETTSSPEVQEALLTHLGKDLAGGVKGKRGSREKAATVLTRTWITPPKDLEALRNDCLALMETATDSSTRLAMHWAILGAVYPFWLAVATSVGRLLRLQRTVTASQVRRRLSETYGDRELVARATRTVLRSYVDWQVLEGVEPRGTYRMSAQTEVEDPRLVALLAQGILYSELNGTMPVQEMMNHPALFPFSLTQVHSRALADGSSHLEIHQTGSGKVITLT